MLFTWRTEMPLYRLFEKFVLAKLLFLFWFFIACSPVLLLRWLYPESTEKSSGLTWITGSWALICLIVSWWFSKTNVHYMIDDQLGFPEAVKRSWYDARLRLAFIPLIGTWFIPDEDKTKYDDDDDIHSHRLE